MFIILFGLWWSGSGGAALYWRAGMCGDGRAVDDHIGQKAVIVAFFMGYQSLGQALPSPPLCTTREALVDEMPLHPRHTF